MGHWFQNFRFDRLALIALITGALFMAGRVWLIDNPQFNPWSPLSLDDPPGWATARKIADLRDDPQECRAILTRSNIAFEALEPVGEGACRRSDRIVVSDQNLQPARPQMSCAVAAGFELWKRRSLNPAARDIMGSPVASVEHLGTYNCRRIYGRKSGSWSEHATGNAIDIAGFVLEDGTRISVLRDWDNPDEPKKAAFLRHIRDAACGAFGTVLSPDYNDAHADHFHLDQEGRAFSFCR
ncbi:extensin family protein [Altericroceibacterium endophyticum]|uniref:Extensin n=1 Tax=Altericroceibacterium endophyticum TaxID=1808508 RepID=A0A6I4T186_9SPHN|nr:extensin family protein [Altericroceibacterium endophyticum]MXO64638.1 extensin [Altericroceibacterium endophyticum]